MQVKSILRKSLLAKFMKMGILFHEIARNLITESNGEKHFPSVRSSEKQISSNK